MSLKSKLKCIFKEKENLGDPFEILIVKHPRGNNFPVRDIPISIFHPTRRVYFYICSRDSVRVGLSADGTIHIYSVSRMNSAS